MANHGLCCQVCHINFYGIFKFQGHLTSKVHKEKMKKVFPNDTLKSPGFFPYIISMSPQSKNLVKQPMIGMSLLTLCFSTDTQVYFYLCHVCEKKCGPDEIACHLSSDDHCTNYFAYKNPNALSFSWVLSMDVRHIMQSEIIKDVKTNGPGDLQMLVLPGNLLTKVEKSTYSEVMHTLCENEVLLHLLKDFKPKMTMIETYQRNSNRLHPLLGMQHIVECVCEGATEKRYYLCTLCKLTLTSQTIIKHILSFDHISCYFREWHPSTLMSKECYTEYTKPFAAAILDFAKQTERIHGTAKANMKKVSLEPAKFASVNFSCYAEALKELESITKENEESSLITPIIPGEKLESRTSSGSSLWYSLRCQDCSLIFQSLGAYHNHLFTPKHKQMLLKIFGKDEHINPGISPNLGLCRYLLESRGHSQPLIGVPLGVVCVCSEAQVEPVYVCFACRSVLHKSSTRQHFESQKHLINTLLHQNPWRLPFGWKDHLQLKDLRSLALEEEKQRGPKKMMLKVFDIPYSLIMNFTLNYNQVMASLDRHHTFMLREVPRCETYSKLEQNERFPLLGNQFLVMHDVYSTQPLHADMGFLCLLCQRRLSDKECYAHVFSWEHVASFINRFHPGSLNSTTDAETLLDLAKQAARIHSISHMQKIQLNGPIREPCSYQQAIHIIRGAKKRAGHGQLEPHIVPKTKLVPRKTEAKDSQDNNRMTSQKSTDNAVTTEKISAEVAAEITNAHCVESAENAKKSAEKDSPAPNTDESENNEVFSKTSLDERNYGGGELCQVAQGEEVKELTKGGTSGETPGSWQNSDKDKMTAFTEEKSKSTNEANERKRSSSMFGKSEEDACPNAEEPRNPPSIEQSHQTAQDEVSLNVSDQHLWQYIKRSSREPVIGLNALLECCCDKREAIYLCECCCLTIPEKNIISHVTGVDHQKMYLMELQKLPLPPETNIRHLAALFEQEHGYGYAEAVELDEETHKMISEQDFKLAIQTVKALQAQQDSHELPLFSAPSAVQPADTSVPPQAQHTVCPFIDDYQVLEMEIDEESEAESSSVTAAVSVLSERIPKTTESNKDIRVTQTKECEAADGTNTCLTVSKSNEDTSSQHVSTSGRDTTRLHPDSTRAASKAEITSSRSVGPSAPSHTTATDSKLTETTSKQTADDTVSSTTPKMKNASTNSQTKSKRVGVSQTTVTPLTSAKKIETSVKCRNTEASSRTVLKKNTEGSNAEAAPNLAKSKAPAAPHLTTLTSENKNQTKPTPGPLKVGKNHLIWVFCKEKQQVYCKLCSVRMQDSSHLNILAHAFNYVKMKDPVKAGKLPDKESVNKLAAQFAMAEQHEGVQPSQKIKVTSDVYKELAALPEAKALQRLKVMLRQRDSRFPSSSIADTADDSQVVSASPCDISSPDYAVRMETPQGGADSLATDSESAGRSSQTPDTWKQQQKTLDDTHRKPPAKTCNPDRLSPAAPLKTEQQDQPRLDQKAQREPKRRAAAQAVPWISVGERIQDCSHLSKYLRVTGLKSQSVVGLSFVWECRGISRKSFFLCESCGETLSLNDICQHMVSDKHQFNYMKMQHPEFLWFWTEADLLPYMKLEILNSVAQKLAVRERYHQMDAQVILLRQEWYEYVWKAPFSEALEMVQNIKRQKDLRATCPPGWAAQQKEKHHLERTVVGGDLNAVKQRVSTPLDLIGASSKADSVVSPGPGADTCLSPPEICRRPSTQTELKPPVKQEEVHWESPSSSICSPKTSQTQSCPPTRKRPLSPSPETLRPCTKTPRLDDPLPAKHTLASLQPITHPSTESASESTPEEPAVTSTLLPSVDKDSGPGSEGKVVSSVDQTPFKQLMALVRKIQSEVPVPPSRSAPDDAETTNSGTVKAARGVQRRWDQDCVQSECKRAKIQKWDSKVEVIKATVKKNPPRDASSEGVIRTAAPVVSGSENQPVSSNVHSSITADYHLIKTIISTRQDPRKKKFVDDHNGVKKMTPQGGCVNTHISIIKPKLPR